MGITSTSKMAAVLILLSSVNCFAAQPDVAGKIVEAAKAQAREETAYSPQYFKLAYPNGDPPRDKGACTDVVIRSLRGAGFDLQALIHEDMKRRFNDYPQKWSLPAPDANIDHRRVPNQLCFMARFGKALSAEVSPKTLREWLPGDIVYWKLDSGLDHCGIVSDTRGPGGNPLVIHNLGRCCEEDCLAKWKITGHYRYPKSE